MKTLEDIELKELLPDSISKDKNVDASAIAIDPQLKTITLSVDMPTIYTRIDELSSLALDHLATQYDVKPYRDNWTLDLKRNVLKANIANKRKVGTLSAVKAAIAALGSSATVIEWWEQEPKGKPHTFNIKVVLSKYEGILESELQEDILTAINEAKPVRSHYSFILQESLKNEIGVYGCIRIATYAVMRSTDKHSTRATGVIGTLATGRAIIKRHLIGQA